MAQPSLILQLRRSASLSGLFVLAYSGGYGCVLSVTSDQLATWAALVLLLALFTRDVRSNALRLSERSVARSVGRPTTLGVCVKQRLGDAHAGSAAAFSHPLLVILHLEDTEQRPLRVLVPFDAVRPEEFRRLRVQLLEA